MTDTPTDPAKLRELREKYLDETERWDHEACSEPVQTTIDRLCAELAAKDAVLADTITIRVPLAPGVMQLNIDGRWLHTSETGETEYGGSYPDIYAAHAALVAAGKQEDK